MGVGSGSPRPPMPPGGGWIGGEGAVGGWVKLGVRKVMATPGLKSRGPITPDPLHSVAAPRLPPYPTQAKVWSPAT